MNKYKLLTYAKRLGKALHVWSPRKLTTTTGVVQTQMLDGVCAFWHGGLPPQDQIDVIKSFRTPLVRAAVENPAQLQVVLNVGVKVIALIEKCDLDLVRAIASFIAINPPGIENLVGVELGNEIDLTETSAKDFGTFVSQGTYLLRTIGNYRGDVISGGISRVREDTLAFLREALAECPKDILIGIHRYSIDNEAEIAQDGYYNREEESAAIQEVANGRTLACTEFGYPLLDPSSQADMDKAVDSIEHDCYWWTRLGAKYLVYYQWTDGPTNTPIDRFGLRKLDGTYRATLNWLKG